jgi:hypothetical protein
MGLADDVEAERLRRQEAAERKAEEFRERERGLEARSVIAAWYTERPWASPSDASPDVPPGEYREVLLEAVGRIPRRLWKRGVLYRDPHGKEVFSRRTRGTRWRRSLYTRYVRWVSATEVVHPDVDGTAWGPYGGATYWPPASWSFTLLDDGRVTNLHGDLDKIRQRIVQMILDGR